MKFVCNLAQLQACADHVARLNNKVYSSVDEARSDILGVLNSTAKNAANNRYINRPHDYPITVSTGGFVIVINPEYPGAGVREVNFLIDPFIADLPCYIDRNDNETVEI